MLFGTGLAALAVTGDADADTAQAPQAMPPQAGDLLVQATGPQAGQPIGLPLFKTPNTLIQAWAKDPTSGVVRNGSRLNRVLLVKIDTAAMDDATRKRSAEGVVAYSDFCTHAGCWIETYHADNGVILCHCHGSAFDPTHGANVTGGPARAPLASLSLKIVDSHLVAAGPFDGRLGIPQT